MDVLAALKNVPVIAILRSQDASVDRLCAVTAALAEAGLVAIELTLSTPNALAALRRLAADPPAGIALGAGTVLDADQARDAVGAGATYLITPGLRPDVVAAAAELGVPVMPGALTPSEVLQAWETGGQGDPVTAVKVFPASAVGGPGYVKALLEPLPHVPLIPTGGVSPDNARAYLDAGATAVGMGGSLLGDALAGGDLDALRDRTARVLAAVATAGP